MGGLRQGLRFTLAALLLSYWMAAPAQEAASTVEEVKAAYLQKFPAFITWPSSAFETSTSDFVMAVLEDEAVFRELSKLAVGRQVQGRPLVVRRLTQLDALERLHVVYIGRKAADVRNGSTSLARKQVLVVTDVPGGLERGAIVNFIVVDGKVRFELSLPAAAFADLKLDSRLVTVAERVKGATP